MKRFGFLILILLTINFESFGQNAITSPGVSAQNVVQNVLLNPSVVASNFTFQGNVNTQLGIFENGTNAIGFENGVILSTGQLIHTNAVGQNVNMTGANTVGTNIFNLTGITSANTNNAAVLTFNFEAEGNIAFFEYVFASYEYNTYVNSNFNDVFGFFVSGPNPAGGNYVNKNIAIIPGTTNTPVSINTVNNGNGCPSNGFNNSFPEYFVDNCNGNNIPLNFRGRTKVLPAFVEVVPCQTYTITLAVADVGDGALNSGVFLKAGSFSTGNVTISADYNYSNALNDTILYEGCSNLTINFNKDGPGLNDTTFFEISGTATNGVDYTDSLGNSINNFIVFPFGSSTGSIVIYPVQDNTPEPDETITITIYNVSGCNNDTTISTVTFIIVNVDPFLQIITSPDVSVCEGDTVTLSATVSGGVPPYNTTWIWPDGTAANPFSIAPTQTTNFQVYASDGCAQFDNDTVDVVVTVFPNSIEVVENVNGISCNLNDGNINLDITGNNPVFSVEWNNGLTGETLDSLLAGTYVYTIVDNVGCRYQGSITISPLILIDLDFIDVFTCSGIDIELNNNALDGFNWTWTSDTALSDANAASPIFNLINTSAQPITINYDVVADSADVCATGNLSVTVFPNPVLNIQPSDTTILCNGVTQIIDAGSGFSTYLWNSGESASSIEVTTTGWYSVEVSDSNNCTALDSVFINFVPSNISVIATVVDADCFGVSNGTIQLQIDGDNPPFSVLWGDGGTQNPKQNLSAGTYIVMLTDSLGCSISDSIVVSQPQNIELNLPNLSICSGLDLFINPGFISGINYQWSPTENLDSANISNPIFNTVNNSSGNQVYVINFQVDSAGYCGTGSFEITVFPLPIVQLSPLDTVLTCTGTSILLDAGVADSAMAAFQSYLWNTGSTDTTIFADVAGWYSVEVVDSNVCVNSDSVYVSIVSDFAINLTYQIENVSCFGLSDGNIEAFSTGTFPPFVANWNNGASGFLNSNLIENEYIIVVVDSIGCTLIDTVFINQPLDIEIDFEEVFVCSNVDIELNTDFINNINYIWSPSENLSDTTIAKPIFNAVNPNISNDVYTYIVKLDSTGACTFREFTVNVFPQVLVSIFEEDSASICFGTNINLVANGYVDGAPVWSHFLWNTGDSINEISVNTEGWYSVIVEDVNQCSDVDSVFLSIMPAEIILTSEIENVSCFGLNDGSISLQISGAHPNFSINWEDFENQIFLENLFEGIYPLSVTDALGCILLDTLMISQPTPILLQMDDVEICPRVELELNPDFVEGIIYTWNPDLGLNANNIGNPTILLDNTSSNFISYIYTVQYDSTGACSIDSFEVTVRPLPRININPQDSVFVCIGTSAVLDAGIAEVGLPTFSQYEWITGQNTQQITVDTQGVYSIKITDVLGCINFDSVFVEVNQPSIIVTTLIELCLGDSLILKIEDYSGGLVYWNGVQYGPQFTAYQSGTYEAIYQNACGIYVSNFTVEKAPDVMLEDIPNVLTPNNDGINDILITDAFLETTDLQISIFNRWGNLIYQTIDPLVNWDGKTNMGEVVDGVYFLTAEFKNCNDKRQKLAKSITVLR